MPDQPNPSALLGGYAPSTLSREERELLFAAALEDQQLFDELVNEEPLRELLKDPLERQKLIDELSEERPVSGRWFPLAALRMGSVRARPLAFAGGGALILVAAIVAFVLRSAGPPADQPTMRASRQAQVPRPAPDRPPLIIELQKEAVKPADAPVARGQDLARQVDALRKLAREQFARGERQQALATTTNALRMQPNDSGLKAILDEALTDARARLRQAHDIATAGGEPVHRWTIYRDAERREQEVHRLASAGRSEEAIRSAWAATDLFTQATRRAIELGSPTSPAGPTSSSAPPQTPDSEEPAIRALLQAYARGYSNKDAPLVKRLFPAVDERELQQSFRTMKSTVVQIRDEQILSLTSTTATVSCTWDAVFVGPDGRSQRESPTVVLRFQKAGGSWIIVDRR